MAGPAAQLDEAKRFAEIVAILQKHHLVQGLTPEKVRDIFVDLGPTFVKFGQILSMRSDILPKEYCLALETLRTDVTPMPLTEVERILTQAYARPWQEVFSDIGIRPLGSASIAQVHAATLTDGQRVVVKVQRPDLYEIMSRDVRLLKRAAVLLKYTPLASALDFHAVLDEIWRTVQQELDFTIEADNIAEFKRLNDGVAYADCPATYPKWCTKNVLVMEYIGGHQIDDAAGLRADGYDLNEIAVKLVHNYIRQITVYRFFHADPHPGNIRVQDGKIVWLDLGMMGRISPREAELYMGIIRTIYEQDVPALTDTLLSLGQYTRMPDRQALTERIGDTGKRGTECRDEAEGHAALYTHARSGVHGRAGGRVRADPQRIRRVRARLADDARAQPARHSGYAHERVAGRERHRDRGGVCQEHRPEPRAH